MQWAALIALAIVALDQLTKWLVVRSLTPEDTRVVIAGFFSLVNVSNTGAAWGIFKDNNLILTVVSILAVIGLYFFRHTFQPHRAANRIALGLIAGGIVGNLIDRIRVGYVIDFLLFYIQQYRWPAFNIADSAICVGVALFIIVSWRSDRSPAKTAPA